MIDFYASYLKNRTYIPYYEFLLIVGVEVCTPIDNAY